MQVEAGAGNGDRGCRMSSSLLVGDTVILTQPRRIPDVAWGKDNICRAEATRSSPVVEEQLRTPDECKSLFRHPRMAFCS